MTQSAPSSSVWSSVVRRFYPITILLSAFLIFQVQPLISKYILPWFGGTPGVWTTCMLFFQVALFAGYAYAHASIRYLSPRGQAGLHAVLLLIAGLLLPICPDASWKPAAGDPPTWHILGLLLASVGLPYFLLSATGPLLQGWFSQTQPGQSPYRLYALSNIGSVLGLVTYPFLFEPLLTAEAQAGLWSLGFVLFAGCCAVCAWHLGTTATTRTAVPTEATAAPEESGLVPTWGLRLTWAALAACASVMLLATTNQVCLDVAVIPFLWVLPLTFYLLSFILCFDQAWWYPRRMYAVALTGTIACLYVLALSGGDVPLHTQVVAHFGALFFGCMVCHGELVRLKPEPRYLTGFYLTMSAGGALGGLLVGLVAPLVFSRFIELHVALLGCSVIGLVIFLREIEAHAARPQVRWLFGCVLLALFGGLRAIATMASEAEAGEVTVSRNFYGVLRVARSDDDDPEQAMLRLVHGRIVHGMQFLKPERRAIPTSYYGEQAGVGLVLTADEHTLPRKIGVVGLGVGTLATYGRPGDHFRMYEINPDVIRLANDYFTYLNDTQAHCEMVLGDARLSLEAEPDQHFDVLVLDAFSSDAIPAHLLTEEAFRIYLRHLNPEGVLAIHISNRHFDLQPVVRGAAERFGLQSAKIRSATIASRAQARAEWMLLSRDGAILSRPDIAAAIASTVQSDRAPILWTDTHNNVVGVLK